jgi:hypothetical protein
MHPFDILGSPVGAVFQRKTLFFLAAWALIAVSPVRAQGPAGIGELVACVNAKLVNHGDVNMTAAIETCMPQGCKVTSSMSTASAQPACSIAGTQLPRIFLNCPGPSPGLRFRPTFTLCSRDVNRIEVGEDVAPIAPSPASPMLMANIDIPLNQPMTHDLSNYLNTPNNNLRCTRCHGNASPGAFGTTPLLSVAFDPFTVQRRNLLPFVIYSTEPTKKALISPGATVGGVPIVAQTLEQTCARIESTLEVNPFAFGPGAPSRALCSALAAYTRNRSCGQGVAGARCTGVSGGGLFVENGVSSTVTLEFSGQAVADPEAPGKLTFRTNDVEGVLNAFNASTQKTINAAAISELNQTEGVDLDGVSGEGNYTFSGAGSAWINGVAAPIALRISFNKAANSSRVSISSPSGEFYAGGTAVGVRFTVTPAVP